MKKTIIYICLSLAFGIIGLAYSKTFNAFSISLLDLSNISLRSFSMNSQFKSSVVFTVSIGMLPLFFLFIQKKANLNTFKESLMPASIILSCGFITWALRILHLNLQFKSYSNNLISNKAEFAYDTGTLFFGVYIFIGFTIGMIISIFLLRKKNEIKILS